MGGGRGEAPPELHAAARSGDLVAVQSIVSSKPLAVNSRDKHSRTPLHLAAWSGQAEVVSYLCKNKADVGAAAMDDMGAIHFASQKGHLEVVRILLSCGVSVNAANRKGFTPLHYAVQGSHLELTKYLAKKGASLRVKTRAGKTPFDLASNKDISLYLEECQKTSIPGNENVKRKPESVDSDSTLQDKSQNSGGEGTEEQLEGKHADEGVKRKGEDDSKESPSEPKRAKVSLNHLLSADDTQEDDE